jgi:UDP-N-acetylglucosamine 2-epimerase (non-hydrolysing)
LRNVVVLEPLAYAPFCSLIAASALVLTDSGGLQEEAPSVGKPVLVMRDTTERPEAVHAGTVALVGADEEEIIRMGSMLLDDRDAYRAMSRAVNPYGDGAAAGRSVAAIERLLGVGEELPEFAPLAVEQAAI